MDLGGKITSRADASVPPYRLAGSTDRHQLCSDFGAAFEQLIHFRRDHITQRQLQFLKLLA